MNYQKKYETKIEEFEKKYPFPCCIIKPSQVSKKPIYAYASLVGVNTINETVDGINISLPDFQVMSGVLVNDENNIFTIQKEGIYYISFHLNGEGSVLGFSRLILNGNTILQSVINQGASQPSQSAEIIMAFHPGDQISLQLYGIDTRVTLGIGVGASLSIYKLD